VFDVFLELANTCSCFLDLVGVLLCSVKVLILITVTKLAIYPQKLMHTTYTMQRYNIVLVTLNLVVLF